MKIRQETKVRNPTTFREIVFGTTVLGIVGAAIADPLLLPISIVYGIAVGFFVSRSEAKKQTGRLMNDDALANQALREAVRTGQRKITLKNELSGINPNQPFLGKVFLGPEKISKEIIYFIDYDD